MKKKKEKVSRGGLEWLLEKDLTEKPVSNELFTISPLPSTTLGVTAVKLQNAKFLLYDTPGICPSAHRIRLLTTMLAEEQRKVKLLFPRKRITPTVFTLDVNHSVLIGSLAQIDYKAVENVLFHLDNEVDESGDRLLVFTALSPRLQDRKHAILVEQACWSVIHSSLFRRTVFNYRRHSVSKHLRVQAGVPRSKRGVFWKDCIGFLIDRSKTRSCPARPNPSSTLLLSTSALGDSDGSPSSR